MERKTNWIAVVVSVVATMFIGFLWYGALFQQQWMAGNGITMEGEKYFKNGTEMPMSAMPMVFNTLIMVVYALVVNWLLQRIGVNTWMEGAKVGAAVGLVVTLNVIVGNLFASNPSSLSMVDGSYAFVLFAVLGTILGGWQKKARE